MCTWPCSELANGGSVWQIGKGRPPLMGSLPPGSCTFPLSVPYHLQSSLG